MPEWLQIQGNSGKASNSCNKQTNATTTKRTVEFLRQIWYLQKKKLGNVYRASQKKVSFRIFSAGHIETQIWAILGILGISGQFFGNSGYFGHFWAFLGNSGQIWAFWANSERKFFLGRPVVSLPPSLPPWYDWTHCVPREIVQRVRLWFVVLFSPVFVRLQPFICLLSSIFAPVAAAAC